MCVRKLIISMMLSIWIYADLASSEKQGTETTRETILLRILNRTNYDSRIPPDFNRDVPTNVSVNLVINSFDSISEATMEFAANLLITQTWSDSRLTFTEPLKKILFLELDAKMMEDVWVPDLYFANEKRAAFHDVTVPNKLLHLYENGTIVYSARVSMTATCPMRLQRYPLDTQICSIYIKSFTYTAENVVLQWSSPISLAIEFDKEFKMSQFNLANHSLELCSSIASGRQGNFTCLSASFTLQRHISYYLIQLYFPGVLIVALSWMSFWLDQDAVPARISLGILTVLTMTTQNDGAQASLPKVSYVKAVDVWSTLCLVFVFGALLEYSVVNYLTRKQLRRLCGNRNYKVDGTSEPLCSFKKLENQIELCPDLEQAYVTIPDHDARRRAAKIDRVSRVAFPVAFAFFICTYTIFYAFYTPSSDET